MMVGVAVTTVMRGLCSRQMFRWQCAQSPVSDALMVTLVEHQCHPPGPKTEGLNIYILIQPYVFKAQFLSTAIIDTI
jgi:hypothetical protein